jgi:hypothetical protein
MRLNLPVLLVLAGACAALSPVARAEGYQDTPMLPDGKWHVHDGLRPQPTVVTPGTFSTPEKPGAPPSDAVVLFDGTDLSKWKSGKGGGPAAWKVHDGYMEVTAKTGDILTKDEFGDCQLHAEFCEPNPPSGNGQGRGNSGIFFFGMYEIQVLDCYNNPSYADGMTGCVYGQYPPLVNACRKPGEWQVYDIVWTAPRFKDGKLESPAYVTILLNGVVVQNHAQLLGPTGHKSRPPYTAHGPKGPLKLQDHGNPVRYRNIWVRPLKGYDEK